MSQTSRDGVGHRRRGIAAAVAGALAACALGFVLTNALGSAGLAPACGRVAQPMRMPDGSRACVHTDEAPAGVDVTEPVATAELRSRVGAGPKAYAAAEDLGVPTALASTATSPEVTCDGDGTSGYRVQAMYVVEANKPNRFAAMEGTFQRWAAGVDDVVNRSAALTGGVRHVRFVTTSSGGTCVADVLNVTVPAGAMSSFNATIQAVSAQDYRDPRVKYLMWTDAASQCGIATLYPNDTPAQSNPNNGSYPQYARIDSGCWGLGNGSYEHSVEAHELTHTLGGVQSSAPHATKAGHCWDEADTMCYADGGGHAMVSVCTPSLEYLLDCNSDDYFSTYPDPGSYLESHWDAASSRFLVGGGDGTGGGDAGAPTVLGARIGVNNPAVPGLSTQVSVTPSLPAGRTLTSVLWTSARRDCSFATPTEVQSTLTCPATATGSTTVTAKLIDSTGATRSVTSPLTFATGTARPVTAVLSVAGQRAEGADSASLCTGASAPVSALLTDAATGQPVKGLPTAFTRKTATQTVASSAGTALTSAVGVATVNQASTVPVTFGVSTKAAAVYAAAAPVTMPATVARCSPTMTAEASTLDTYAGDPVTVTGRLTRTVGDEVLGIAGAAFPVSLTTTGTVAGRTTTRTTTLASARTAADGSFSVAVKPVTSGVLTASLPASASYTATSVELGDLAVHLPASALTADLAASDIGYGAPLVVTGRLDRLAGDATTGVAGSTVTARVTPTGRPAVVVGTARTAADGSYRIATPLRASGQLAVGYAGSTVLPAATRSLGAVTAGTWDTSLSASTSAASVAPGGSVKVTGTLTRAYGGNSEPAKAVVVRLYSRPSGASADTVSAATTMATGAFTFSARPARTTSYTVRVAGVPGYADASAPTRTVTVP